ncbi:MAG: MaoC family dehydratase [Promethearchaeota archaeon]|nr:MAG: MaoC family dehydratase [Candidatus Lokiarchaeota archaeon]
MTYEEKTYADINVGDKAVFTKTVSEADDYMFAGITGDFNPMHVDEEYAKNTMFKGRICHGALSVGFISTVLGMKLPGPGCIYGGQTVRFTLPIHHGDTVSARAEVIEKFTKKEGKLKFLKIKTTVTIDNCVKDPSHNGKEATVGEAEILMLK